MADGISGVAMGNLLVGSKPDYEPPPSSEWIPRPAPGGAQLVANELRHRITAPLRLIGSSRTEGGHGSGLRSSGVRGLVGNALRQASPTPLNVQVGPHRRFDWTKMPFEEVRRAGKRAGGTVNDVVLAVATGALRDHLKHRGAAVNDLDFRAVIPVNVRTDAQSDALGNRVSELIARLPIALADPWKRLLEVVDLTQELKASGQSGAGDLFGQAIDLLPTQLLIPLFRLISRSSVANVIMTNVPGPRVPVYLLGARQLETYPVVPLLANQTLGIALMSYEDGLFWGINADWDAVPDLHDLVESIDKGFAELIEVTPAPQPDASIGTSSTSSPRAPRATPTER